MVIIVKTAWYSVIYLVSVLASNAVDRQRIDYSIELVFVVSPPPDQYVKHQSIN